MTPGQVKSSQEKIISLPKPRPRRPRSWKYRGNVLAYLFLPDYARHDLFNCELVAWCLLSRDRLLRLTAVSHRAGIMLAVARGFESPRSVFFYCFLMKFFRLTSIYNSQCAVHKPATQDLPSSEYTCDIRVAISHNTCSCRSSDHGGPQRFHTGRQPHMTPGAGPKLGQNEACAQPPPKATQAAPNQP